MKVPGMKVQIINKNGGPEVFESAQLDKPVAKPGQVLVKVAASSVNTADLMARSMGPVVDFIPKTPAVLGMDFAGTVESVGDGVTGFQPGDTVFGCAGGVAQHQGTLAEYLAADTRLISKKPEGLSMVEAASLPLVSITAYEALVDRLKLKAGQKVLIHGGAGGVGSVAIQIAKSLGAEVYATGSGAARIEAIKSLGATAIDYKAQDVGSYVKQYTDGQGFDVVFDTVGGANLPTSFAGVKLNGEVATTVSIGEIDLTTAHLRGVSLHVIYMLIPMIHGQGADRHAEILQEMKALVDDGKVRPLVDSVFPLEKAADAHRKL